MNASSTEGVEAVTFGNIRSARNTAAGPQFWHGPNAGGCECPTGVFRPNGPETQRPPMSDRPRLVRTMAPAHLTLNILQAHQCSKLGLGFDQMPAMPVEQFSFARLQARMQVDHEVIVAVAPEEAGVFQ